MRLLSITLISLVVFAALAVQPAHAAGVPVRDAGAVAARQSTPKPVNDHDESRVGVQLVIVGIAAGLVVGVGTGAYLLRRKLGLTAYSPDQAAGGHH